MTAVCAECGPQVPPIVHTRCHPHPPLRHHGCGHLLARHTDGLKCRDCGNNCAVDARPHPRPTIWTTADHPPAAVGAQQLALEVPDPD